MAITKDSKRAEYGDHLRKYASQGTNSCNVLASIKTSLASMKTTMQADADFDQSDVDEVTAVQLDLKTQIEAIV